MARALHLEEPHSLLLFCLTLLNIPQGTQTKLSTYYLSVNETDKFKSEYFSDTESG